MHALIYVTLRYPDFESEDVRGHVADELTREGFVDGRWSVGWGSDFEIGGRWSGELSRLVRRSDPRRSVGPLDPEDDAVVLTPGLYDLCLAQFEGLAERRPDWAGQPGLLDLDEIPISRDAHLSYLDEDEPEQVQWLLLLDLSGKPGCHDRAGGSCSAA